MIVKRGRGIARFIIVITTEPPSTLLPFERQRLTQLQTRGCPGAPALALPRFTGKPLKICIISLEIELNGNSALTFCIYNGYTLALRDE